MLEFKLGLWFGEGHFNLRKKITTNKECIFQFSFPKLKSFINKTRNLKFNIKNYCFTVKFESVKVLTFDSNQS